jgi:hypothetical protein
MDGQDIVLILRIILGLFTLCPFYLLARKKYYYFVPNSIITRKTKDILIVIQSGLTGLFAIVTYIAIRDNEKFVKLVEDGFAIIPAFLVLFLLFYGIIIGYLTMWVYRKIDDKYDSFFDGK